MEIYACLIYLTFGLLIFQSEIHVSFGILYPRESETREVKSLDGIWNFVKSEEPSPTQGLDDEWFLNELSAAKPTIPMPVPASYNDISTEQIFRDHVGTVWYDRKFFVPKSWQKDQRVMIRFGSVHYRADVWINGNKVAEHEIGHLPFEAEITKFVHFGKENLITVLCDNSLTQTSIPQGNIHQVSNDDGPIIIQSYTFDFFNYAGIHRSVHLYTTPKIYIEDVSITTDLDLTLNQGKVFFDITGYESSPTKFDLQVSVQLYDKEGNSVANATSIKYLKGVLTVPNVKPWWPFLMHKEPGYLYNMEIFLQKANTNELLDVYRMKVGIKTLTWNNTSFLINGKRPYFRGFGKHEDSDIRGKGLDLALMTRDINLLKWVGANTYRTSHYPYSEESMQLADEEGIMVIDECPGINSEIYSQALLDSHKSSMEQLIRRDKNYASVIMWSIANEPRTQSVLADKYFSSLANFTRSLDNSHPVTAAFGFGVDDDKAAQHIDIIGFNRYNAWYGNTGRLDMITKRVVEEGFRWHTKHNRPVMMLEYGSDTMEGLHLLPSFVFSEEYQTELFAKHFKAFDILRQNSWFIGEFVWNFADFKTAQTVTRVGGNKKGIFTRNRQPKAVAHLLRKRYYALGQELDKCNLPNDLFLYIIKDDNNLKEHDSSEL